MVVDCPEAACVDLSIPKAPVYRAAPINEALIDCAKALLPETALLQVNGMTEVATTVMILPEVFHGGEGRGCGMVRSAGQPTFEVQLRIVNAGNCSLRDGEVGEVGETVAHSPAVMLGYWNKPGNRIAGLPAW